MIVWFVVEVIFVCVCCEYNIEDNFVVDKIIMDICVKVI